MTTTTEPGTNAMTRAVDALVDAAKNSASWQEITETTTKSNPVEASGEYVFFDYQHGPIDGHAFALEELESQRVMALVMPDPDNPFIIRPGHAEGVELTGGVVLMFVERLVRDSEKNSEVNQQRWLQNRLVDMVLEMRAYLVALKGERWFQGFPMKQSPIVNEEKVEGTQGYRQTAALALRWGPASVGLGA